MTFRPQPKPAPRTKKPKKRIKQVSKKRQTERREYKKLRDAYLAEHPDCEMKLKGCTVQATEGHHMKGCRGAMLLDVRYFMAACRSCHDWVTEHSAEAIKMGLSLKRVNF